jgi:hypothetical protein
LPAQDIRLIGDALSPGGHLAVVNNVRRAVPSVEIGWADDDVDVRAMLNGAFRVVRSGALDAQVVGQQVSETTFWATHTAAPRAPSAA